MQQMVETQRAIILEATKKPEKKLALIAIEGSRNRAISMEMRTSCNGRFVWRFVASIHADMEDVMAWAEV